MSSWSEERRRNLAAEGDQRRKDKDADADRHRKEREAEAKLRRAERRADRDEKRAERAQRRREKAQRKQARAAKRERTLTPGNVYKRGTLLLVAFSALASLPAQIIHFVSISWLLLPIGPAVESAAWVMAAGVAHADERKLPAWVRWLLRGLSMGAAAFAASINYKYGVSLGDHGLSRSDAQIAGIGLAAVTMLGPLFFEVRQWVLTLTVDATDPRKRAEEKARARHEKQRRRNHPSVAKVADRLMSAAAFGSLKPEDAWARAWEIKHGTIEPGMTPALHANAHAARTALATAFDEANGSPVSIRGRLLEILHPTAAGRRQTPPVTARGVTEKPQVVTDLPPSSETAKKKGRRKPPPHRRIKGDGLPFHPLAKTQAADTARKFTAVNGHHA